MKPILREWLTEAEARGLMKRVRREVSPIHELAAVGKLLEPQYGAFFERVAGSAIPVVTGLAASREAMAQSIGLSVRELPDRFNDALTRLTPCKTLNREDETF